MPWDYASEAAWHNAKCACRHERDQHEDDGCYGSGLGEPPCLCEGFTA